MICFELNWLFYDQSWMLQLSEFTLRSSVFLTIFLLIDATSVRSKIRSIQKVYKFRTYKEKRDCTPNEWSVSSEI